MRVRAACWCLRLGGSSERQRRAWRPSPRHQQHPPPCTSDIRTPSPPFPVNAERVFCENGNPPKRRMRKSDMIKNICSNAVIIR